MNQMQDFTKEEKKFLKSDLYKSVKKRKNKLVNKLIGTHKSQWASLLPLTRVQRESDLDDIVDFLNVVQNKDHSEYVISEECPRVFLAKKREGSDFLWVEYFRLYCISKDQASIQRYSYVECYFDKYVMSCIMDTAQLRKDGVFSALNMDKKDWGYAKQQIQYWNKFIIPVIEELPVDLDTYPLATKARIDYYTHWERKPLQKKQACPDVTDPLWSVVTYLHLFQMLPILPKKYVPWYYINLVCKNKTDCQIFAERLRMFLADHFRKDPIIRGDIKILQHFRDDKELVIQENAAIPYVFVPEKLKDMDQLRKMMNNCAGDHRKKKNHPLRNNVPICVSEQNILDTTAMNIVVGDMDKMQWSSTAYDRVKEMCGIVYDFPRLYGSKKGARENLKLAFRETLNQMKMIVAERGYTVDTINQILRTEEDYIVLATWFRMMWKESLHIDGNEEQAEWFSILFEKLVNKQYALDAIIDELMIRLKKEVDELPDERPLYTGRNTEREQKFRTTIMGDTKVSLLCYHPAYFENYITTYAPHVNMMPLLRRMKEKGMLKVKGEDTLLYGIGLNREDKLQATKKTENYYAFIIE